MTIYEVTYLYFACTALGLILGIIWAFFFAWAKF